MMKHVRDPELKPARTGCARRTALPVLLSILLAVWCGSCGGAVSDLRSLVPKKTSIYLETGDLGSLLSDLAENAGAAEDKTARDYSFLSGIEVAVAVAGFEAEEGPPGDRRDGAVINLKPQFAAVFETNAWTWQVRPLVVGVLDRWVRAMMGKGSEMKTIFANGSERFIWTSSKGRSSFAEIRGSRIYFGNDAKFFEATLGVADGNSESLLSEPFAGPWSERGADVLARGLVTSGGVKKVSLIAGVSFAVERADQEARALVSGVLPQLIDNTVREITWTARRSGDSIRDEIDIRLSRESAEVFRSTMVASDTVDRGILELIPPDSSRVTRYASRDPRIAFRSLLLVAGDKVDARSASLLPLIWNSILEPYGITDAEAFLALVEPTMLTTEASRNNGEGIAIVQTREFGKLKGVVDPGIDFASLPETIGNARIWSSKTSDVSVAVTDDYVILGNRDVIKRSVDRAAPGRDRRKGTSIDIRTTAEFERLRRPGSLAVTISRDENGGSGMEALLGAGDRAKSKSQGITTTETQFTRTGIRRVYRSRFGFIGSVIEQTSFE